MSEKNPFLSTRTNKTTSPPGRPRKSNGLPMSTQVGNIKSNSPSLNSRQYAPKTGLPDFGTIFIEYSPNEKCIELKSLKEYVLAFRNVGIFHENVVNKILEDLIQAVDPNYLKVIGDYNIRGGVKTIVSREYKK